MVFMNTVKKKEDFSVPGFMPPPPSESLPTDQIIQFRQQGYSDRQIVQYLQGKGFETDRIADAMNQVDQAMKGPVPPQQQPAQQAPPQAPQENFAPSSDVERIEEIAEAIIEEKWKDVLKNIDKVTAWKSQIDSKVASMERDVNNLKASFDKLHTAILGKIGEYDQNIVDLGAEIKAMERVFQKLLPTFTENVSELSRITSKLKKK